MDKLLIVGFLFSIIGSGFTFWIGKKYENKITNKYFVSFIVLGTTILLMDFAKDLRGTISNINYYLVRILFFSNVIFFVWSAFKDFIFAKKTK